jgi:hypothetical protein
VRRIERIRERIVHVFAPLHLALHGAAAAVIARVTREDHASSAELLGWNMIDAEFIDLVGSEMPETQRADIPTRTALDDMLQSVGSAIEPRR